MIALDSLSDNSLRLNIQRSAPRTTLMPHYTDKVVFSTPRARSSVVRAVDS